jgi:hypothetical protein
MACSNHRRLLRIFIRKRLSFRQVFRTQSSNGVTLIFGTVGKTVSFLFVTEIGLAILEAVWVAFDFFHKIRWSQIEGISEVDFLLLFGLILLHLSTSKILGHDLSRRKYIDTFETVLLRRLLQVLIHESGYWSPS